MRLILLAGYNASPVESCPWLQPVHGLPLLEYRLREAREWAHQIVLVLSGDSAEAALRTCPTIEKCELVFDTHATQMSCLSNLKAALRLGRDMAVVHPAELPFGEKKVLRRLMAWAVQQGVQNPKHLIQAIDSRGEFINRGFPLILTSAGCQEIDQNAKISGLADTQLRIEYVA